MSESDDADVESVMIEIVNYLKQRHNAADTPEGIRLWWLRQGEQRSVDLVYAALQRLLDDRQIEEVELLDGTSVYRAISAGPLH